MTQAPPPAGMTLQRTSRDPEQVRAALTAWLRAALPADGGLFEHGVLGRHDPSGFRDWFDLAP